MFRICLNFCFYFVLPCVSGILTELNRFFKYFRLEPIFATTQEAPKITAHLKRVQISISFLPLGLISPIHTVQWLNDWAMKYPLAFGFLIYWTRLAVTFDIFPIRSPITWYGSLILHLSHFFIYSYDGSKISLHEKCLNVTLFHQGGVKMSDSHGKAMLAINKNGPVAETLLLYVYQVSISSTFYKQLLRT